MAAPRVADYVQELFKDSPVKVRMSIITSIFCFCFFFKKNSEFGIFVDLFSVYNFFLFFIFLNIYLWFFCDSLIHVFSPQTSAFVHRQVEVVSDLKTLEKEYPCLAAVNRCANSKTSLTHKAVKMGFFLKLSN